MMNTDFSRSLSFRNCDKHRILLHACCGPCSLEPVRILRSEGIEPVIFYANSNIHPADEYERRLATLRAWAEDENVEVVEGTYDTEAWEATAGRIGDAAEAKHGIITGKEGDLEDAPGTNTPSGNDSAGDDLKDVPGTDSPSWIASTGGDPEDIPGADPLSGTDSAEDDLKDVPGADSLFGTDSVGGDSSRPSRPDARAACVATCSTRMISSRPSRPDARAAREARCRACYHLRFEEAARYAREHGFAALGTTLSVSPYQYTRIIREELERAAAREGIATRFQDFRPFYDEATRRSREAGMYRQNYCGCRFSDEEAAAERAERKAARRAAREAELAAHADERAAEEAKRARNRAEKQAYAVKQAKKRAILKALREQGR